MLRSLFSGVSGMRNHQTRMDVIGNNIANVNTVAYKTSNVNFKDIFSQTIQGATAANNNRGGTNPMQVGLGMSVANISVNHTQGSTQYTGKTTDLAIEGDGFFTISDGENKYYTRAGNFDLDSDGRLVSATNGYNLLRGDRPTAGDFKEPAAASVTGMYDGTYAQYQADMVVAISRANASDNPTPLYTIDTIPIQHIPNHYRTIKIPSDAIFTIDKAGTVSVVKEDGTLEDYGTIGVAKFNNPGGLLKTGDNMYIPSSNSGLALEGIPGQNDTGSITPGSLEMSNVDLSQEFTDMIITQRGFQANSRVITTSDEILNELVNLKR